MPPKNVLESQLSDEVQGAHRALKTFEILPGYCLTHKNNLIATSLSPVKPLNR